LHLQRDVIINWIKKGRKKPNAEIEADAILLTIEKG